ncbi:MAG: sigma-70 family RNA polymerase sigma factor [Prevotella sp.]|nr:sigma-70 family RNA polymerase sigma factor [Prevotella sp.]
MFSMEVTRLIERCRQGDADALGELYKAYAQRMRGVCRRYVSDEQAVSDVLHDAFVIIFTSFDKLRDDRRAEAWMMSITRNVASKYKDHLSKMALVPLEEAGHLQMPEGESDVRGVPLEDVLQLVDRLPEGYGQVFRLSVFEGMSHKEIAVALGIEPHSSSSQLARAKKMLRKMMQQYWAAVLLLLLVPMTFYLFRKPDPAVKDDDGGEQLPSPVIAKQQDAPKDKPAERPQEPVRQEMAQATDTATTDTLSNVIAQEPAIADTTPSDTVRTTDEVETPHYDIADLFPEKPTTVVRRQQKWSVDLAYVGGFGEQDYKRPYGFTEMPVIVPVDVPPSPVTFKNWSDYAAFLSEIPDEISSHKRRLIMNIALNNAADAPGTDADKIVRKSHHYMPVSFSLALKYRLSDRLALETGLSYSRLRSEFEMGSNGNTINEQQTIHYVGIPLKATYTLYDTKAWSLYGSLGVAAEMPLRSQLTTGYYLHGLLEATDEATIRAPWQWSVGTGFGLQYNLTPTIGLFAEPSLQYYIPTGSQIETYRTEHPLTFSLPLGVRFTW